jgi:anti-anti-sigma regulatory factor
VKRAKKDKGRNVIGFDPLLWMKDGGTESGVLSTESGVASHESTTNTDPEPVVPTQHSRLSTQGSPGVVPLGDMLTIEQAAAMHDLLHPHLGQALITIEAGAVQRVDAAGLQLLTAFVQAVETRNGCIRWQAPSAALRDGARLLGLAGALGLDGDPARAA